MSNPNPEWRDVPGYEGHYLVSSDGQIASIKNDNFRLRKTKVHRDGYRQINLMRDGITRWFLVHRLVGMAFIENPRAVSTINHKDGNRSNNLVENLEWVTSSENCIHAYQVLGRTPTKILGAKSSQSKLTEIDVIAIKTWRANGTTCQELCELFSVSNETIRRIGLGKAWAHVHI